MRTAQATPSQKPLQAIRWVACLAIATFAVSCVCEDQSESSRAGGLDDDPITTPQTLAQATLMTNPYNELTPEEAYVIEDKGTEARNVGEYTDNKELGTYLCRRCNAKLYVAEQKFASNCGWPSFDDAVADAVRQEPDADGRRTEILCAHCDGHLGHVFLGEGYTEKNTRHCVNSLSMRFYPEGEQLPPIGWLRAPKR
jgi:methionine-R-sulfoxide reductase